MNELLQKHGCSNVFNVPEGLRELMADISREVLRWQPPKIYEFIANYLSALLITREHGIMAVKILENLCDCRPTVSEHLLQVGFEQKEARAMSQIMQEEIEGCEPEEGKEKVKEYMILKKILERFPLDEEMSAKVCQVARNAYRDYWYRRNIMRKGMTTRFDQPWEQAVERTLELYKKTKPSISELNRAAERIQAAYKGYHVRRNVLRHLELKKPGRKVELPGPPLDVDQSRNIDLGTMVNIKPLEDDMTVMFEEHVTENLGLHHDPMKTITHIDDNVFLDGKKATVTRIDSVPRTTKSDTSKSKFGFAPSFSREIVKDDSRKDIESHKQYSYISAGSIKSTSKLAPSLSTRISFAAAPTEVILSFDNEAAEGIAEEVGSPEQAGEDFEVPEMIMTSTTEDGQEGTDEVEDETMVSSRSATTDGMSDVPEEA